MSGVTDALAVTRRHERRRAARQLLRTPLVPAALEPAAHTEIRRHAGWLQEWFTTNTGWRLVVTQDVARLIKTCAADVDPTSPAREGPGRPAFTRRRYVLAALAMAVLERAETQITLGRLAEQVLLAATDPALAEAGVTFALDTREQRGDLVAVVRLLLGWGVLRKVAGDEDGFLSADGDALYDIDRRLLAALPAARRGPSTITETDPASRVRELAAERLPDHEEQRTQRLRWSLTRRLLDDPVLYLSELTEEELAYLSNQRRAITGRISEFTGLVAEIRAEGIAMVDPDDELTDLRMPDAGTDGHATLLLAEHLAARPDETVPLNDLHALTRDLAQRFRTYWRRAAAEPGAETTIVAGALERLAGLRLVTVTAEGVRARPALARFSVDEPVVAPRRNAAETGGQ